MWIHPFQERLQILALHREFECVPVQPFAHSFKPSAVAVSRIRVLEFHFRIFRSRREHQRNDVRRRGVQLRVFLQYGKDVAIGLQGENATRFADGKRDGHGGIARMRPDIDRHIAGRQELAQIIDGLLCDFFFGFVRMQPLRVFDDAIAGKVKLL